MKHTYTLALILLLFFQQAYSDTSWNLSTNTQKNYHAPTLANGMLGVRVSSQPLTSEKILLNGLFDKYGEDNVPSLVEALRPLTIIISADGQTNKNPKNIKNWQQQLNLKTAALSTQFDLGDKLSIQYTLRTLRHLPFNILQQFKFTALKNTHIIIRNQISLPKTLNAQKHSFFTYKRKHVHIPLLLTEAKTPKGLFTVAAANTYIFNHGIPKLSHSDSKNENQIEFHTALQKGETYEFSITSAVTSSAHYQDPANEAQRLSIFAKLQGRDLLVKKHQQAWDALWKSDIQIQGDDEAQRSIRFALFNLYSFVRAGTDYSLPPMGLSNVDYYGHIFWDCELWMLPPILLLHPELAKSLLDYRFHRLAAAKRNAQAHGYRGAMFPWESDQLGEESTPIWALTGPFEHHITAVVGIAFWNYYRVTQDKTWLKDKGYPVLKAVADFWTSRVNENNDGSYNIDNVVGADEYAENVDNNAFTNGAAITVLKYAAQAAEVLSIKPDPNWRNIADNIIIERFADGTTKEYKDYDGRQVKQADVNLLSFPLAIINNKKTINKDLEYYSKRFDPKGPAMTHSILSVIASRLGDQKSAWNYFQKAYIPNQRPPYGVLAEGAFDNNPYFATAAGGLLQSVLAGFAGLEITDEGIVQLDTKLPAHWKSLIITGVGKENKTITILQ